MMAPDVLSKIWIYPTMTAEELAPYQAAEKPAERYSLETYDTNVFTKTLFEVLDRRIRNLSPDIKREFKKLYVAYKLDTNFADIVFQKQRLRISLNMKFSEVRDAQNQQQKSLILIDGDKLSNLMVQYEVGIQKTSRPIYLYRVDEAYFE